MITDPLPELNAQSVPRLTITGLAEIDPDPALKQAWLALHPYAAIYADFEDFHLWRIRPNGGLLVAGFARATKLQQVDLTPDALAVKDVANNASAIMAHCNSDHANVLALLADGSGIWHMVAVDVDGCDLAQDQTVLRIHWSAPVNSAGEIRAQIINLANSKRGR